MIDRLIEKARGLGCSDIHLTVGKPCVFRQHGVLIPSGVDMSDAETEKLILSLCDDGKVELLAEGKDLDFSYETPTGERQRINVYRQSGKLAAAIRLLNNHIPTIDELKLPDIVRSLAELPRGLVLVTGPTGSGKSTTLASMVDHVNANRSVHILTIEDPIEYVYDDKKAVIGQRETGRDTESFASALRSALREDPDVILVGEMRDFETISAAVTAAETGHLVFSTLHTTGASQTVDRIVDVCPENAQKQMRVQLASVLRGVVTQALLPDATGTGRIVATEVLLGTDAVQNLIRESKTYQLTSCMQSGAALGMHTFDSDLSRLVRQGKISRETALEWAFAPKDLVI